LIPCRVIIDGKEHNLQRRKFCLKCSPFGSHNTKVDDPSRPTLRKRDYRKIPIEKRRQYARRAVERGHERKDKLIEMSGGACERCGYSGCRAALDFHHKDSAKKNFNLVTNNLWSKPWDTIVIEWKKCSLLCKNCHAEVEYGQK
jgi:hypothetical protein